MSGRESDLLPASKVDGDVEIAVNVDSGDVIIDKDRDVDFDIGNVGVNDVSPAVEDTVFDKVGFTVANVSTVVGAVVVIDEVVEKLVE